MAFGVMLAERDQRSAKLFLEAALAVELAFGAGAAILTTFVRTQVDRHTADAGAFQGVGSFARHAGRQFNRARLVVEGDAADEAAFDAGFVGNGADDVLDLNAVIPAHIDAVTHHVAARRRTGRALFATRTLATVLEAGLVATIGTRLAFITFAKAARTRAAVTAVEGGGRGGTRVFTDDLQRFAFLGHHGQRGGNFLGADVLLFGNLRDDVGEEIEAFGVEHFNDLLLEVGNALVGHVGTAGQR